MKDKYLNTIINQNYIFCPGKTSKYTLVVVKSKIRSFNGISVIIYRDNNKIYSDFIIEGYNSIITNLNSSEKINSNLAKDKDSTFLYLNNLIKHKKRFFTNIYV